MRQRVAFWAAPAAHRMPASAAASVRSWWSLLTLHKLPRRRRGGAHGRERQLAEGPGSAFGGPSEYRTALFVSSSACTLRMSGGGGLVLSAPMGRRPHPSSLFLLVLHPVHCGPRRTPALPSLMNPSQAPSKLSNPVTQALPKRNPEQSSQVYLPDFHFANPLPQMDRSPGHCFHVPPLCFFSCTHLPFICMTCLCFLPDHILRVTWGRLCGVAKSRTRMKWLSSSRLPLVTCNLLSSGTHWGQHCPKHLTQITSFNPFNKLWGGHYYFSCFRVEERKTGSLTSRPLVFCLHSRRAVTWMQAVCSWLDHQIILNHEPCQVIPAGPTSLEMRATLYITGLCYAHFLNI